MHASDGWINTQAMIVSRRRAPCCWSAVFQRSRCRHWLSPVHRLQIATLRWYLTWTCIETWAGIFSPSTGRMFTGNSCPNPVQYDISPHCHSQLSDLTIRLYSLTSLKSVSLKWWLSPNVQTFLLISLTLYFQITWSVILHSDWSIASQLTLLWP